MYLWWKFLHLAGVLGFVMFHGVSIFVTFRLRKERDRERIRALIQLSGSTVTGFYISFALLVAGGVLAAFSGHWWNALWLWEAIGVLVVSSAAMVFMAKPYFRKVNEKAALRASGAPMASDEELAEILTSSRPLVLAGIGFGALAIILYLMVFKPA